MLIQYYIFTCCLEDAQSNVTKQSALEDRVGLFFTDALQMKTNNIFHQIRPNY